MLLNAVPNPAGRFSKLDPSPLNCAAVIIPIESTFVTSSYVKTPDRFKLVAVITPVALICLTS